MAIIRQIRPTEGVALREIRLRALAESPSAFGSTLTETAARPAEYWDGRARGDAGGQESTLFVAEDADRWVGLVGGVLEQLDGTRRVELISMWVDPAYRGRGLGQGLVERVVAWARQHGASAVGLWVTETNSPAVSLYRRCGFTSTRETQPLPSDETLLEQRMILQL